MSTFAHGVCDGLLTPFASPLLSFQRRAVAGNFDSEKDQALKLLEKMGRKKGVTIATKTGFKDADAPVASMR